MGTDAEIDPASPMVDRAQATFGQVRQTEAHVSRAKLGQNLAIGLSSKSGQSWPDLGQSSPKSAKCRVWAEADRCRPNSPEAHQTPPEFDRERRNFQRRIAPMSTDVGQCSTYAGRCRSDIGRIRSAHRGCERSAHAAKNGAWHVPRASSSRARHAARPRRRRLTKCARGRVCDRRASNS